jgi:cohesin complex subunit SA-1/2
MMAANAIKLLELQDALFGSLRDALDGEEVATLALTDDQVAALEAILLRISLLERSRDLVDIMEDEEGGQSPGWDIICAFAERGELGYKEEEKVNDHFSAGGWR